MRYLSGTTSRRSRKQISGDTMISNADWRILEQTNQMLALSWEALRRARVSRDTHTIKMAEMSYFQALQNVIVSTQNAVAQNAVSNVKRA